jgi:hypothetical protein
MDTSKKFLCACNPCDCNPCACTNCACDRPAFTEKSEQPERWPHLAAVLGADRSRAGQ